MKKEKKAKSELSWLERQFVKVIVNRIKKYIHNMENTSPKTTLLAWLKLIAFALGAAAMLLDGDPNTIPEVNDLWLLLAGVGLVVPDFIQGLFTRDNKVSDEKAGAK